MSLTIYWAGDSTVKRNDFTTYPQTGIGQVMNLFIKDDITIKNHAENGRSTKSFIEESRLATIYNEIREGDLLFIQFGHNDAKIEDANRYAEPFGDYQINLEKFINVARNRSAYPVLITPLCRRHFKDNAILEKEIHGDYPKAMLEVAKKLDVPVIDLYEESRRLIQYIGIEKSKKYFMNLEAKEYPNFLDGLEDNTHLKYEGAVAFAELIAKGLKELGDIYQSVLTNPECL